MYVHLSEFGDCLRACGFQYVRYGYDTHDAVATGYDEYRLALSFESLYVGNTVVCYYSVVFHHQSVADEVAFTLYFAANSFAEYSLKFRYRQSRSPFGGGTFRNGFRQGVLAPHLEATGDGEQLFLRNTVGNDVCCLQSALCESACLVEYYAIQLVCCLECFARFYQYAVLGSFARAYHYCNGCSQSQCTRTRYYQHGYCRRQSELDRRSCQKPHDSRQYGYAYHYRHEYSGDLVGKFGYRSSRAACLLYEPYYLGKHSVFAYLGGSDTYETVAVDSCLNDVAADAFLYRYAFSRYCRLVYRGISLYYLPVDRYTSTRFHYHCIAYLHLFDRYFGLYSLPFDNSRVGRHIHQPFEGFACLASRPRFEILAYGNQCQYHCRRFEIKIHSISVDNIVSVVYQTVANHIYGKNSVYDGCRRAYRYEAVHRRCSVYKRFVAFYVVVPIDVHYR